MATSTSRTDHTTFLTIRQVAWILGVPKDSVHRAIRRGTLRATWRRSQLVIPTAAVVRLLGGAR